MAKPPSSSLLAILAILATASGSPTPLPFLCPSSSHYGRHFPRSQPTTTPVPVKFIQCSDGLWRRAEFYELYGSTFCGVSYGILDPHPHPHFPSLHFVHLHRQPPPVDTLAQRLPITAMTYGILYLRDGIQSLQQTEVQLSL